MSHKNHVASSVSPTPQQQHLQQPCSKHFQIGTAPCSNHECTRYKTKMYQYHSSVLGKQKHSTSLSPMEYLLGSETGETSTRKKPAKTATFSSDKRRPVWARPKERRKVSPLAARCHSVWSPWCPLNLVPQQMKIWGAPLSAKYWKLRMQLLINWIVQSLKKKQQTSRVNWTLLNLTKGKHKSRSTFIWARAAQGTHWHHWRRWWSGTHQATLTVESTLGCRVGFPWYLWTPKKLVKNDRALSPTNIWVITVINP